MLIAKFAAVTNRTPLVIFLSFDTVVSSSVFTSIRLTHGLGKPYSGETLPNMIMPAQEDVY